MGRASVAVWDEREGPRPGPPRLAGWPSSARWAVSVGSPSPPTATAGPASWGRPWERPCWPARTPLLVAASARAKSCLYGIASSRALPWPPRSGGRRAG